MKIVQFDNGKWALQRFSLFYLRIVYKDLASCNDWYWPQNSQFFEDCLADSKDDLIKKIGLSKLKIIHKEPL